MATQRQISKEQSIASILDAAAAEFSGKGYSGATVRSIAARAGVANGLVGRYFDSKENLLCAVLKDYNLSSLYEGVTETDSFRIFCIYLDRVRALQKENHVIFMLLLRVASENGFPQAVYEEIRSHFEGSLLEAAILKEQAEGRAISGDAFEIFRILTGTVYVLLHQYETIGTEAPDNQSILHVLGYKREEVLDLANQQRHIKAFGDMVNAALWSGMIGEDSRTLNVLWSDEFRRMLGFEETEEDFPNTEEAWSERLHPADRERVLADLSGCLKSRDTEHFIYDTQYRIMRKDGEYRWYRAVGRMEETDGGRRRFYGIIYDISAERQIEESGRIIGALAEDYSGVNYIELAGNSLGDITVGYRTSRLLKTAIPGWDGEKNFSKRLDLLRDRIVYAPDRESFHADTRREVVVARLQESDSYSVYTRFLIGGETEYFLIKFSPVRENGVLKGVVAGLRSVDKEKRILQKAEEYERLVEGAAGSPGAASV